MDCEGGNDADLDACVVDSEATEDVAYTYDCGDFWEDLVACTDERSRCGNNNFGPGDDCDAEENRLADCINKRR